MGFADIKLAPSGAYRERGDQIRVTAHKPWLWRKINAQP
jgi:hypothetical protein